MKETRLVLCGGAIAPKASAPDAKRLVLDLHGAKRNVHLKIADISQAMARSVPEALIDLLEIAVYVFAADQASGRGGARDTGDAWRRAFMFHIPVRRPDLWSRPDVTEALVDLLSFLSDDNYAFAFTKYERPAGVQLYLDKVVPQFEADEVMLFSGGLDSLAGTIQEAIIDKRRVVLISHDSAPKRKPQIAGLAGEIIRRAAPGTVRHIPVHATKAKIGHGEYTQRTRSFLYAALGVTVASMLGRDRIRFYENGVTSINLPIAEQVVGGRATRTTHPQSIQGFARLFSCLLERPFTVESPFLWKTKGDIVRLIKDNGCGALVAQSVSCSKTVEATKLHTHCGRCSQCIDRRFATLAVGLGDEEDPPEMYKVDLLTGERSIGENRAMAESFLQRATRLRSIAELDFLVAYPQVTRVLLHVGLSADEAGQRILELHHRHAEEVFAALAEGFKRHAREFQEGKLPETCLLVLNVPGRYRQASSDGVPTVPTFRREGDYWKVWFDNERTSLKDSAGARHIARLLGTPGRQWHSLDLLADEAKHDGPTPAGSAGEASDAKALGTLRARKREMEDEIAEAEAAGDPERLVDLRREAQQIEAHLKSVTNIKGAARKAADDQERARKAVQMAVARTMKAISKSHPALWRHLRESLNLGVFCTYEPDPPLTWVAA